MGLLKWLGLGGASGPPVPTVVVAGLSGSGRKSLLRAVKSGLAPEKEMVVCLFDVLPDAVAQLEAAHIHVCPFVSCCGAVKCSCCGSSNVPVRRAVRQILKGHAPDVLAVHVARGKSAHEVLGDLVRVGKRVQLVGMTATLRADSALQDLRDPEDDVVSFVRAAGQVLLTRVENAGEDILTAVRQRVRALSPEAVLVEDEATAARNILKQLAAAGVALAEPAGE